MFSRVRSCVALMGVIYVAAAAEAVEVQIFNPNWNMTLTDYGYADLLFDDTPGFQGREYLSGEWAAAVAYRRGGVTVSPTWLEPHFIFPDWNTNSNFTVVSPIAATGQLWGRDASAASTVANPDLSIAISYEMLDSVTGMPMGMSPASASAGAFRDSNRYVMKQTYTLTNISGDDLSDLNLFQFIHALHGIESLYDNRSYVGPMGDYRYDTTQTSIDPTFSGGADGGITFRDYIGFGSKVAPVAIDNGRYGIDGVDNHGTGKPGTGTHLRIESDSLNDLDYFADATQPLWVGGAQKYLLGNLPNGQSTSIDFMVSVRTGTVISDTGECSGSANGGSSVPGGVDFVFEDITTPGDFFAEYNVCDEEELAEHIAHGEFTAPLFAIPGTFQLFEIEFEGEFDGSVILTIGYDDGLLPAGFDETLLRVYHFDGDAWVDLGGVVDSFANTIQVTTDTLSPFGLGAVPEPTAGSLLLLCAASLRRRRR